jgi:hypothetical protein
MGPGVQTFVRQLNQDAALTYHGRHWQRPCPCTGQRQDRVIRRGEQPQPLNVGRMSVVFPTPPGVPMRTGTLLREALLRGPDRSWTAQIERALSIRSSEQRLPEQKTRSICAIQLGWT